MNLLRIRMIAFAVGMTVLPWMSVQAQDMSVPQVHTADIGTLFPNDETYREGDANLNAKARDHAAGSRDRGRNATLQAQFETRRRAAMASMEPEYRRRIARDGKPSADAWLKRTAYAFGKREGENMRRAQTK